MVLRVLLQSSFFPSDPATQWVLIGGAIMAMLYIYMRSTKKKKDPLAKSPYPSSLAQQRGVEREMQNLLVELANMSRQITAQLDTRAARLEELIRQADERIESLHRAATSASGSASSMPSPTTGNGSSYPAAPAAAGTTEIDLRHREVYDLVDQGRTPQEVSQHLNRPIGEIELILALRAR